MNDATNLDKISETKHLHRKNRVPLQKIIFFLEDVEDEPHTTIHREAQAMYP